MNWKRKLAKEWIWLICTVTGVLLAWNIFVYILPDVTISEFWEEIFTDTRVRLIVISSIALLYIIRLTIWAIKELGRPNMKSKGEEKKLEDRLEKGKAGEAALEILAKEPKGKEKKDTKKRTITFY